MNHGNLALQWFPFLGLFLCLGVRDYQFHSGGTKDVKNFMFNGRNKNKIVQQDFPSANAVFVHEYLFQSPLSCADQDKQRRKW